MENKIATAIVTATKDIFNTMVQMTVKEGTPRSERMTADAYDLRGIIGVSGSTIGAVGVHFPKALASRIAAALIGTPVTETSSEVKDTVGELTNMIAGGMRNELAQFGIDFDLSIPTVVEGNNHNTAMQLDAPLILIPFKIESDEFLVEACLKKV